MRIFVHAPVGVGQADGAQQLHNVRAPLGVRWDGRLAGRPAAPGRYRLQVSVLSDRAAVVRRYGVRLLGR